LGEATRPEARKVMFPVLWRELTAAPPATCGLAIKMSAKANRLNVYGWTMIHETKGNRSLLGEGRSFALFDLDSAAFVKGTVCETKAIKFEFRQGSFRPLSQ
jgi:hypothetical protein